MSPRILIGESTSSYPFSDVSYLYAPGIFMGKILFEKECPTQSPSNSIPPSFAPSNVASERYAYIDLLLISLVISVLPVREL